MRRKMRICSWMAARRLFLFTGQPWAYLRNLSTGNSLGFLLTVDRWCIIKIKEEILSIFHHCSTKEKKKGKWRWNSGGWHEEFFDLEWRLVLEEICKFICIPSQHLGSSFSSFSQRKWRKMEPYAYDSSVIPGGHKFLFKWYAARLSQKMAPIVSSFLGATPHG